LDIEPLILKSAALLGNDKGRVIWIDKPIEQDNKFPRGGLIGDPNPSAQEETDGKHGPRALVEW
jgi:hypothetical protein